MIRLYKILSVILLPIILLYLSYRLFKGREDKNRILERLAIPSIKRPEGNLIWIHAVSVGEANCAMIMLEELIQNTKYNILFTTSSLTSARIVESKIKQFEPRVFHQFLPIDSLFIVQKFIKYWKPNLVLFTCSEIWPNMLTKAKKYGAKLFLVNASLSEKSTRKWLFAKKFGFNIFDYFNKIFTQSKIDLARAKTLTSTEIYCYGNLKSQAKTLFYKEESLQEIKNQIGERTFFVAASTHKGEEEIVFNIHKNLKNKFPDLLTILIPRHPIRAKEIIDLAGQMNVVQRSKNEIITNQTEIYLADTLGELGLFYKLADFAFLGGSMFAIGGHNPFEAIKLDCAVISGKHVFNFEETYQELDQNHACILVDDANQLALEIEKMLVDKQLTNEISLNARRICKNYDEITSKILQQIRED